MNSYAFELSSAVPRISTPFRLRFSVFVLLCGWTLAAFSLPVVRVGSAWSAAADAIGWCCFTLGASIRFWSICHLAGRKTRVVVDTGPYAMCRNPLYVGTLLIVASETAFLKSAWFVMALMALIAFYQLCVVPAEEHRLSARLGAEFRAYAARVPRWLPRFDRKCLEPVPLRDRSAIMAEIQCLVWWTIVPILGHVTCYVRVQPWWPHYVPGF